MLFLVVNNASAGSELQTGSFVNNVFLFFCFYVKSAESFPLWIFQALTYHWLYCSTYEEEQFNTRKAGHKVHLSPWLVFFQLPVTRLYHGELFIVTSIISLHLQLGFPTIQTTVPRWYNKKGLRGQKASCHSASRSKNDKVKIPRAENCNEQKYRWGWGSICYEQVDRGGKKEANGDRF